ncbi:DUF3085 domain-containing protein [Rhizobium sp. BK313]|uniref:DUF3085 domain-containing protein n=1 Tax=Rhizobium sp. BK313 TaxID=2587081 RepID=UPI0028B1519F|nr:DUF3085 domain-containing protein [Rhizobium sp. BK313]
MPKGKLAERHEPPRSRECDPRIGEDWFEIKRRTFGGDEWCRVYRCRRPVGHDGSKPRSDASEDRVHRRRLQLFVVARD